MNMSNMNSMSVTEIIIIGIVIGTLVCLTGFGLGAWIAALSSGPLRGHRNFGLDSNKCMWTESKKEVK